jgi:hypothetical protein
MKKLLLFSLLLNVLLIIAACGGGPHKSTGSDASAKLHAFVGAMPGFRGLIAKPNTAFDFSIVPKLQAQTASAVTFAGSYSGFCPSLNMTSGSAAVLWSGSQDPSACNGTTYPDAPTAAANAPATQLVIGSGTLGPLVAYADSSTWTVRAFIQRGGQTIDTGIAAKLDGKRGTSTATFQVQDGDTLAVVALSDGTPSKNLQFVLEKQ